VQEGDPLNSYITEEAAFSSETVREAYAKTKAMATASVIEAMKEGLRANIIFPSGVIGPGDYGRGSFTSMLLFFMEGKLPLAVEGGYDFVDVRDVAEGIAPLYERAFILRKKPFFFTPYAISVLYSNGYFSRKKAEKELGYTPRRGMESIGDTLQWLKSIKNPKA